MGTASMTTGQFREFAGAVLRSLPDDLDHTTAQRWIENQESLRKILRKALVSDGNTYPLSVDYGRSVEDAVWAGRYDWADFEFASGNFPTKREGKAAIEVELVHFNRHISIDEALRELDRMGYRPAELHELLAFGEKYPEIQREFPVLALGSVWQRRYGDRKVPCLSRVGSRRRLYLHCIENGWLAIFRFAAVRSPR